MTDRPAAHGEFVVGVDGGGTSTDCAVVSLDGLLLGRSSSGPSNPRRVGVEASVESVRQAVVGAARSAEVALPARWACYCIAGAGAPDFRVRVRPLLEGLGLARGATVDHDARAALIGAHGFAPGIVVLAGTGAIAFVQDGAGNEAQIDGWGPLLGDEGSGYWIGLQALKAAARAFDGRGPQTALTEAIAAHLQLEGPRDLVRALPIDRTHSEVVSGLAKICVDIARREDAVARRILVDAAGRLAETAGAALRAVSCTGSVRAALLGGVARIPEVADAFRASIAAEFPGIQLVEPLLEPCVGAALLALREAGVVTDEALLHRLKASSGA